MDPDTDPDAGPDPVIFVSDLQGVNKKLFFFLLILLITFLKVHLHHFSRIKVIKKSRNSRIQCFLTIFAC
jgi:hypothetical protein